MSSNIVPKTDYPNPDIFNMPDRRTWEIATYGNYRPNPYIERMFCYYCMQCNQPDISGLCKDCGTKLFGANTINADTPKIPAREYYDYRWPKLFGTNGRFMPNLMPYGMYQGRYYNAN